MSEAPLYQHDRPVCTSTAFPRRAFSGFRCAINALHIVCTRNNSLQHDVYSNDSLTHDVYCVITVLHMMRIP